MGPGSKEALKALRLVSHQPKLSDKEKNDPFNPLSNYLYPEEGRLFLDKIKNFKKKQLDAMGLGRCEDSRIFVKLTGWEICFLDIKHMLCKLYLFLNKKSPSRMQSTEPNFHLCQCHPAKYNTDDLNPLRVQGGYGWNMTQIANEAKAAFESMDYQLPWKLQF